MSLKPKLPKEFEQRSDLREIEVEQVEQCPVCDQDDKSEYSYGYDYESQTCGNLWKFDKCHNCSHVWLNPRPAISELSTIYPSDYYAYEYEQEISSIAVKAKKKLDDLKFAGILKYAPKDLKSFVDVGCGTGRYLRLMDAKGLDRKKVYGLELTDGSLSSLIKDGYPVFAERVEDCDKISDSSIDLATMFHVIEHVDDPGTVISKIHSWLTPQGIFALETPNIDSQDAERYSKAYWGGYHIPRHWNLFSPETMTKLLEKNGFKVLSIKFQTGHSFWTFSKHHILRYEKDDVKKAEYYHPLNPKGLINLIRYTLYDIVRGKFFGQRTSAMLVIAQKM